MILKSIKNILLVLIIYASTSFSSSNKTNMILTECSIHGTDFVGTAYSPDSARESMKQACFEKFGLGGTATLSVLNKVQLQDEALHKAGTPYLPSPTDVDLSNPDCFTGRSLFF